MSARHVLKKRENANHTGVGQYIKAIKKYNIKLTKPILALHEHNKYMQFVLENKAVDQGEYSGEKGSWTEFLIYQEVLYQQRTQGRICSTTQRFKSAPLPRP